MQFELTPRKRALPKKNRRIPVTHSSLSHDGSNDRYILGYATTELGALRALRKIDSGVTKARQRILRTGGGNHPVWEPAP